MAFNGVIDAITGPSFKMPDGSAQVMTLQEGLQAVKEEVVEKTPVLIEQARESIREPLNDILGKVGRIAYKASPTAFAASASVQYLGGTPSFASFLQPWNLRSKFLLAGNDRHTRIGWPCESFETLNTLSGFVMCESVRLEIPGTATASGATLEEQQLIKQYLENGCFIE